MEPLTLAAAAVALLGPYLGRVGENAAEATAGVAGRLYQAVKEKFRGDEYAEPILRGAEDRPDSRTRLAALEGALAEAIEDDPAFASGVAGMIEKGQTVTDSGAVAGRDVNMRGTYVAGRDLHIGGPEGR